MSKEQTIDHINSINKTIITRIIVLFTLCASTWGLLHHHSSHYSEFVDYYLEKVYLVEQAVKSENLEKYIDSLGDKIEQDLYHDINGAYLLYQLEQSNYEDKTPLYEVLGELKKNRNDLIKSSSSFNLFSFNVTIPIWLFIIPIISLVIFHSLCQLIITRRVMINKVFGENDTEYFPFDIPISKKTVRSKHHKFMSLFFRLFLFIFLYLIIATLLSTSMTHLPLHGNSRKSEFLIGLHLVFFVIGLFDFVIVVYSENLAGIKSLSNWYIKKRNFKKKKWIFVLRRLSIPLFVLYIQYILVFSELDISLIHFLYYINTIIVCLSLPLGVYLYFDRKKKIGKLFIIQGIVMSILFIFIFMSSTARIISTGRDIYNLDEVISFTWVLLIICIPIYWSMNWFYAKNKKD